MDSVCLHQNAAPYPARMVIPRRPQWALLLLVLPFYLMHLSIYQKEGMPQNKTTLRQPPNLPLEIYQAISPFFRHAVCLQQIYGQLSELHHDIPVPAHLSYRSHLCNGTDTYCIIRRDLIHQIHHRIFHDCAETSGACFRSRDFFAIASSASSLKSSCTPIQLKQLHWYCLNQRILRLNQNLHQAVSSRELT